MQSGYNRQDADSFLPKANITRPPTRQHRSGADPDDRHCRPAQCREIHAIQPLVGSRRAIVGDEPGITRDRLYGEAEWGGRPLRIVDTGGILPEDNDLIPAEIFRQARVALDEADAIVLVVDGRSDLLRRILTSRVCCAGARPLFLAVNKIDSEKQAS